MSGAVLQRSKILLFFVIDPNLQKQLSKQILPDKLPLIVYNFHYPSIYYAQLYKHFQVYFQQKITSNHIRMKINDKVLPSSLPLDLYLKAFDTVQVTIDSVAYTGPYQLMLISWKRGFTIVNRDRGCDLIAKKMKQQNKRIIYNKHVQGHATGLHSDILYQGSAIALKIKYGDSLIERKQVQLSLKLSEYIQKQFAGMIDASKHKFITHGIQISLNISLKQLLEQWNYNDGYCYLKIQ